MRDNSLVSIVLPTYNRAHLLPYAIHSVLNQSYQNLELIVIDDNSSDGTLGVVESFDDPRIRYVRNEPNLKLPRALNRGFALSTGAYLTWTSDDNLFVKTAIERMVEVIRSAECDFVYADYFLFTKQDASGRPMDPIHERLPEKLQLEKGNHIGACFLYSREVYEGIGNYDPELFLVEDYDYWMRIANRFEMCHISDPLYFFRRDDATLFCSRYCEVKSADVLVRNKNGLMSDEGLLNSIVSLLIQDIDNLKIPLLRRSFQLVRGVSWRLTQWQQTIARWYLRRRLRPNVMELLNEYRSNRTSFGEAKNALRDIINRLGKVEYRSPQTMKNPVDK